ncbi:hypothetical protein ACSIGC_00135 [Tenacibaculum sp. ZS6-P6]|uniref:hypothetical protein n=1 Tax=Tenacibaculum sp. ZS6-P6 TaxID=3447503 RepID=UPI003F9E36E8
MGLINVINNDSLYELLTNDFHFKYYKDGVGKDRTKSIKNDTIILLKNNLITPEIINKINKSRILLLDSMQICELSFKYDREKKIMRPFLEMLYDEKLNKVVFEIKHLVPQYLNNNYKCIELGENDL